jgi:hypothetical protein
MSYGVMGRTIAKVQKANDATRGETEESHDRTARSSKFNRKLKVFVTS